MSENKNGDQFIKTHFSLLANRDFLIKNRCKYVLYLLTRKFIVREPFEGDLGLHKNFWKKGYLASSKSVGCLSKLFGYNSSSSIRAWLSELEAEKEIVLKNVHVKPGRPQHVFIFGVHNGMSGGDYREYYYIDRPELIDEYGVDNIVDFYKLLKSGTSNC